MDFTEDILPNVEYTNPGEKDEKFKLNSKSSLLAHPDWLRETTLKETARDFRKRVEDRAKFKLSMPEVVCGKK
jgi:hypothetical protein